MGQDPLPRGSLQVADSLAQVIDVIFELAEATVAVEAQDATYVTEHVIVVAVFGVRRAADRAVASLTGQEGVELLLRLGTTSCPTGLRLQTRDETPSLVAVC